jgi:hypothetical protein
MSFAIKINGVEAVSAEMQAAVQDGAQTGLEALGVKGAAMVQDNIKTPYGDLPPAVAFGNLAASVVSTYVRDPAGMGVIIGVGPQLNASAYAAPVETGARPHMPPPSALIPWVIKKFGATDEKHALSIAFAISKSMEKKGTQGHEMFSRALAALEPLAGPAIENSIAQSFLRHGFIPLEGLA